MFQVKINNNYTCMATPECRARCLKLFVCLSGSSELGQFQNWCYISVSGGWEDMNECKESHYTNRAK